MIARMHAGRLFLIRHGDTACSDTGQHTGRTDLPLNPRGEARAAQLKARLSGETFARVFTSPLIRARRTCELAGFGPRAELNDDLYEWNYGQYDGKTSAQIKALRPDWELFRDGAPGGESPADVRRRADRFVALARTIEGDVAAFASGHIIRTIAASWLGADMRVARCFFTATASVGILGYEHGLPVMLLWNETKP